MSTVPYDMFKKITHELNGIRLELTALGKAVRIAADSFRDVPASSADGERLSALEGRIETVLGQVDAGVIKAEALKATARAAEDRMRGHMKRAEGYAKLAESIEGGEEPDPFEAAIGAYEGVVPEGNEVAVDPLPAVQGTLADRRAGREMAKAMKRGR